MKFPARNITAELLALHMLSLYKMSEGTSGCESNKSRVVRCFVSVLNVLVWVLFLVRNSYLACMYT